MISLDLGKIDEFFPFQCEESITICLEVIGTLIIAIWANWISFGFNLKFTLKVLISQIHYSSGPKAHRF